MSAAYVHVKKTLDNVLYLCLMRHSYERAGSLRKQDTAETLVLLHLTS